MAQLIINRLPVPIEIQYIIKDYAFPNQERRRIMNYYKQIFYVLTHKLYHTYPSSHYNMIIVYEHGLRHRWFSVHMCASCGNYIERFYNNVACVC